MDSRFLIHINGTRLPVEREAEVRRITVTDRLDAPSAFSLIVSDEGLNWLDSDDYFVGKGVQISFGYNEDLEVIFDGEITGMDAELSVHSGTVVTLRGKNRLHRLERAKPIRSFTGQTESEIIEEIAGQAGMSPDVMNSTASPLFTLQKNLTGLEYMLDFARRNDCFIKVKEGTNLICKPIPRNTSEDVILEFGKTLLSFNSLCDVTRLISEAEVHSWDYKMTRKISGGSTAADVESSGGILVDERFGGTKETIIDFSVSDDASADKLAECAIARNGRSYIKAAGSCKGDSRILAGSILKLNALGEKLSRKYLVESAVHTFTIRKGYMTEFNLVNFVSAEEAGDENEREVVEESPKNPSITNLQWKNSEGQVINEALVDDMVKMTADVTDIGENQAVKISIYEKDEGQGQGQDQEQEQGQNENQTGEEQDDFIKSVTGKVKNKKIEFSWKVEYHEDTDDEESEQEQQDKGYTLPEYVFVIEYESEDITTEKSPLLQVKDWREVQLLDEAGEPMANEKYTLYDINDNEIDSGSLDGEGFIRIEGIDVKKCYIQFPDIAEERDDESPGNGGPEADSDVSEGDV